MSDVLIDETVQNGSEALQIGAGAADGMRSPLKGSRCASNPNTPIYHPLDPAAVRLGARGRVAQRGPLRFRQTPRSNVERVTQPS